MVDDGNKDGEGSLSEPWVGVTRCTGVGAPSTKKQVMTRLENTWQELWSTLSKGSQREAMKASEEEKPKLEAARDTKCNVPHSIS